MYVPLPQLKLDPYFTSPRFVGCPQGPLTSYSRAFETEALHDAGDENGKQSPWRPPLRVRPLRVRPFRPPWLPCRLSRHFSRDDENCARHPGASGLEESHHAD
jgi:hypothetical protein